MAIISSPQSASSSRSASIDLPSLQPLSHQHDLLTSDVFDPDAFLLSRVHIPLDELRGELREYLSILREELVQLINDDYEEFISLGTGLRGEHDRLNKLQPPMARLHEDVGTVQTRLAEHQEDIEAKLGERTALRDHKATLDLLSRLFETLSRVEALPREANFSRISRVANEYAQLVYLSDKAASEGCKAADAVSIRSKQIKDDILADLSKLLLSDPTCLRIYDALEEWAAAEAVVRSDFRSRCRGIVSPKALNIPAEDRHNLGPSPLTGILNDLFDLALSYTPLFDAEFHILDAVVFPEIVTALLGLTNIFAAGRPHDLHRNYTVAHRFIAKIEELAPSLEVVLAIRDSASYDQLERAWQLPVYFQLRWKEIVANLDSEDKGDFQLPESAGAWKAVQKCKSEDIVLRPLLPRFYRLSRQIISRYQANLLQSLDDIDHVCAAMEDCQRFGISPVPFEDAIVNILSQRCNEALKMVRSVASQFRATSKTQNSEASFFIPTVLKPLHQFLESRSAHNIATRVVDAVFVSYGLNLASVRKTEDLLRRHRKSKKTGFSLFGTTADVDNEEERFNQQMLTDVEALARDARSLGVEVDSLVSWTDLLEICRSDASAANS